MTGTEQFSGTVIVCRRGGLPAVRRTELTQPPDADPRGLLTGEAAFAHGEGHDTEHAAATSMSAKLLNSLQVEALRLLLQHPDGLTDDEGGALMNGDRLRFGRRRYELLRAGYVHDSGERRVTPSGRLAIVWKAGNGQ